jgi:hypothetical protein
MLSSALLAVKNKISCRRTCFPLRTSNYTPKPRYEGGAVVVNLPAIGATFRHERHIMGALIKHTDLPSNNQSKIMKSNEGAYRSLYIYFIRKWPKVLCEKEETTTDSCEKFCCFGQNAYCAKSERYACIDLLITCILTRSYFLLSHRVL